MIFPTHLHSPRPLSFNEFPISTKTHPSFSVRVQCSTTSTPVAGHTIPVLVMSEQRTLNLLPLKQSLVAAAPPVAVARNSGFRPTPELGLFSHLFVLSMAFGALFSVALVSVPTLIAFGRLGVSAKKLSKVVSEEVPGTISSLKLSTMELNELTQQLSSLRHIIGGGKKDETTAKSRSSRSFRKKKPSS